MSVIDPVLDRLVYFVLPADCLHCATPLPWRVPPFNLCQACTERLRRPDVRRCPLCSARLPPDREAWLCLGCQRRSPSFDSLLARWSYEAPLDAVVRAFKFHRLEHLGADLADGLVTAYGEELEAHDVVTPVPLHWRRRWQRGFNQAERIARPLARRLNLPCSTLLRRSRHTAPQMELGRAERARNLRRAFVARRHTRDLASLNIVLVDDVATTGATLEAAASVLKDAGAHRVTALVAGLTPPPEASSRRQNGVIRHDSPLRTER